MEEMSRHDIKCDNFQENHPVFVKYCYIYKRKSWRLGMEEISENGGFYYTRLCICLCGTENKCSWQE